VFEIIHKGGYGKALKKLLKNQEVVAGLPKGKADSSIIERGVYNEFGTENIPSRSFVRVPVINGKNDFFKLAKMEAKKLYELKTTSEKSLSLLGILMSDKMKASFQNNDWAENAESTIKAKGSSVPLSGKTGQLKQSPTYEVRNK